jgi:APA family basic amino acid/polyamine antiporter
MVGSGIFIVSAEISRLTGSPGGLITAWMTTGILTLAAAWPRPGLAFWPFAVSE